MPLNGPDRRRGSALLELTMSFFFLLTISMGVADFGRIIYDGVAIANSASAAVAFASMSEEHSIDATGIETVARNNLLGVPNATVISRVFCQCSEGSETPCDTTCTSKRTYAEVTVRRQFNTLIPYPFITNSTLVGSTCRMRVK